MKCEICKRTGDEISRNHFIYCKAYKSLVHQAHCLKCKYHSYKYSGDWCRYGRKENSNGKTKETGA